MSKRRIKRISQGAEELYAAVADASEERALQGRANELLFTLDRSGSKTAKRKLAAKKVEEATTGSGYSKGEQKLVKRALANQSNGTRKSARTSVKSSETIEKLEDLWGSEAPVSRKKGRVEERNKVGMKVLPGQSYNPSVESHQDVLAEALALEVRKEDEAAEKEKRIEDLDLDKDADEGDAHSINSGSGGDEGDDFSDSDDSDTGAGGKRKGTKQKTKAQRNRATRRQELTNEEVKEKVLKRLHKSIDASATILKSIETHEEKTLRTKEARDEKKKVDMEARRTALSYEEAGSVPLSDELGGSLRTIVPKTVALRERARRMKDNGELGVKRTKGKKKHDKPHGSSDLVWIPKYKVTEARVGGGKGKLLGGGKGDKM